MITDPPVGGKSDRSDYGLTGDGVGRERRLEMMSAVHPDMKKRYCEAVRLKAK